VIKSHYHHQLLRHGDVFFVGNIKFEVIGTPGHTPEHISFLVSDTKSAADSPVGVLSGDFVFVGDVGRPDLLESAAGQHQTMKPAAGILYRSLQEFKLLPEYLQLWPGHGAGSACGKALGAMPMSTVGYELQFNPSILAAGGEEEFIEYILEGQPEPPPYFARMKQENRTGPALLGKLPQPKRENHQKLLELVDKKDIALIDSRDWDKFRQAHVPGALFAPLNKAFNTTAGCYITPDTPIYLIIEEGNLQEAVIDLIRIGLDRIDGYFTFKTFDDYSRNGGKLRSMEEVDVETSRRSLNDNSVLLLDVRREAELKESGSVRGAYNIAHTRLLLRFSEIPLDKSVMVFCRSANRSRYASAFLEKQGFNVTHISGGFLSWQNHPELLVPGLQDSHKINS
jgi:hydroxyacylglutathione hydrolase